MGNKKDLTLAKSIGKKLKQLRSKKFPGHGKMKEMCQLVGVTPQTWNKWEAGKSVPSDLKQRAIADVFDITMPELRGEKMPPAQAGGMGEKFDSHTEALRSASLIRYHLDAAQEYMLRGELSADAFLELTDSLLSAIQDSIAVEGKSLHKTFPLKG